MDLGNRIIIFVIQIYGAQSRMIMTRCDKFSSPIETIPYTTTTPTPPPQEHVMKMIPYKLPQGYDLDDFNYEEERKRINEKMSARKTCSIVVLSNVQNPNMQSLIRKYRYNAQGILIPSSVKYYFKLPQGLRTSPLLVPLNDKAFSPLGGFVRYYKEVPPIPQTW